MKRTSILATMLASALLCIAALGASSASADVLCRDMNLSYNCPAEDTYGVGTEFYAWNYGVLTLNASKETTFNMATCANSEMNMTVTDAGGVWPAYPKVDTANLSFKKCGDDSVSVVSDGTAGITQESLGSGSQQGLFYPSGLQIKVTTNWLYGSGAYTDCVYAIEGPGKIIGWKTDGSSVTRLVFTNAVAKRISGEASLGCLGKSYFSGQYNFPDSLNPFGFNGGIYVLPE